MVIPSENSKQLRAAIYARTSQDADSEDANIKQSIEDQIESCERLATQYNYIISKKHTYRDRNRSGRTYPSTAPKDFVNSDKDFKEYCARHIKDSTERDRPAFGKLFQRIAAGEIDVVLVRDITRLQRTYNSSYLNDFIRQHFKEYGVIVHSCEEGVRDPNNPEHKLYDAISTITKDKEVQMRLAQSKQARLKLRNTGKLIGSPYCYGFESGGKQKVRPMPDELQIVKRIYHAFLNGKSMLNICRSLNDDKIPTKNIAQKKNAVWSDHVVRSILKRICYTGYLFKQSKVKVESPLFMPHKVISLADWEKVQSVLDERSVPSEFNRLPDHAKGGRMARFVKYHHPLRGLAFCGICGRHLYTFKTTNTYRGAKITVHYYRCKAGTDYTTDKRCRKVLIREHNPSQVETMVQNQRGNGLVECLTPLTLTAFIEQSLKGKADPGLDAEKTKLEATLNEINKNERAFSAQFSKGEITKDTWLNVTSDFQSERIKLQAKIKTVEAQQLTSIPIDLPREMVDDPTHLTPDILRQLFLRTFKRITVFPDHINVQLLRGGKFDIQRIRIRNTRLLPFFFKTWASKKSLQRLFYQSLPEKDETTDELIAEGKEKAITADTRIDVVYKYKSSFRKAINPDDHEIKRIYLDEHLIVLAKGHN